MRRWLAIIVAVGAVGLGSTYLILREPLARANARVEAAKSIAIPSHVLAAFRTALISDTQSHRAFLRSNLSGENRTFLAPRKTLRRRFGEKVLAIAITTLHDEDELLRAYVNEIYLGQRGSKQIIGVRDAARVFFGKEIADVTLAEGALLAAIHRSPNTLSPLKHPERALQRRNALLQRMLDRRVINGDEYRGAVGRVNLLRANT